jgi:hypothetical protein
MRARTARILVAATLLAVVGGCSNRKTPVPGKSCLLNSDCESPLTCNFGKCHEPCRENGDCPNGGLCVYAATASSDAQMSEPATARLRVCVQESCAMNSDCPDLLVCGRDLRCRQECAANKDCPPRNQLCVIGNDRGQKVCAEAIDIGDDGQLSRGDAGTLPANDAGAPDVPASDAGGSGGHAPIDANTPDGVPGDAPATMTGTGGKDASSDPPAGNDAVASDAPMDLPALDAPADADPTVIAENEPNDNLGSPTPYVVGTVVAGTMGKADATMDVDDYYEVVAPAGDASGGYFQASINIEVGGGAVFAQVYSAFDNGPLLLADGAPAGQSTFFYWAARPGERYLVRLYEGAGVVPTFKYSFKATYTRIADAYEPNDTSDAPAAIALATPATAYFFAGYNMASAPTPDQDWYQVTLAAGDTHVSITSVPHDVRMQYQVYDSHFVGISATGFVGANPGADLDGGFTAPSPGVYRIAISAFSFVAGSASGRGGMPPDSFTRPYMITVTQPRD